MKIITKMRIKIFISCCTVNHGQGWPKFISNSFLTTADGKSLIQAYLGPLKVKTILADNNTVSVVVDTRYPFYNNMTVTIMASSAFTHYVRIPEWAKTSGGGTIAVNGGSSAPISVNSRSLLAVSAAIGTTTFVLNLPADIEKTYGPTGGVQVSRGPLFWSSDIFHSNKVLASNSASDILYLMSLLNLMPS